MEKPFRMLLDDGWHTRKELEEMRIKAEKFDSIYTIFIDEKHLIASLDDCIKTMQQIRFICERAKAFEVEEKDIEDILELLKGKI